MNTHGIGKDCIIPAELLVQRDLFKLFFIIHQQSLPWLYFYADDDVEDHIYSVML